MILKPQSDPDQAFQAAQNAQAAGDLATAQERYELVLKSAPEHPQTLTMLATVYYQQGHDSRAAKLVDQAIRAYRQMMRDQPSNQPLRAGLINLLLARDRIGEAEKVIARLALPLQPVRSDVADFERRQQDAIARGLPSVVIIALPKSASESIWNRLANGLGLAQCYVSLGLFPDCCAIPSRLRTSARAGVATKEHLPATAHNLAALKAAGLDRVVVHVRDPRQAMLSWAHFVRDDIAKRPLGALWRKIVPPAAILEQPLAQQLDWHIDHYLPIELAWCGGWLACSHDRAADVSVFFSTFERFIQQPDNYFAELLAFLGVDEGLFDRDNAAETIHLRKGQREEWRDVLSAEQQRRAWAAIPERLAAAFGWTA